MTPSRSPSRRRERGAALVAALMFTAMTSTLVGAGLWVSSAHYSRAWNETRSESSLLLAEGGVNDELALLAEGVGNPDPSDPVIASGETMVYPGEGHAVYGRKGSVTGDATETYWVCTSANEWWKSGATPVAWDGVAPTFWITSSAYVKGLWRRTEVQVSKNSIFGQYAVYATGSNGVLDDIVDVSATATVTVTGTSGTNGKVNCHGTGSLSCGNCINSNKGKCSSSQFTPTCTRTGSSISTCTPAYTYPTTCSVLKRSCGLTSYSDSSAWTWMKNNCDNATGIYTYRYGASSSTLSPSTCTRAGYSGTTCRNWSSSSFVSQGCWDYCRSKPGTSGGVKTLVFEPGDYYFTDMQLYYDASTEIVIDSQALASGGTPGQVRFWLYDSTTPVNDNCDLPVTMTKATGATAPDPSLFRVYYGKDGCALSLNRPSGCRDYRGNTLSGDFTFCGGVYSVTKPANDTTALVGTKVNVCGSSGSTNGKCVVNGSMMSDRVGFQGPCAMNFQDASHTKDPCSSAKVCGGYCDGR